MARNNIYLHFLDKELRHSVNANLDTRDIYEAIFTAICLTPGQIFCSYSHLWESNNLIREILPSISPLISAASSQFSQEEFLDVHKKLYSHARQFYPIYFGDNRSFIGSLQPSHPLSGATSYLETHLLRSINNSILDDTTKYTLKQALNMRGEAAITSLIFNNAIGNPSTSVMLKRMISENYCEYYLNGCDATIITGIRSLTFYDQLGNADLIYDLPTFKLILQSLFDVNWNHVFYTDIFKNLNKLLQALEQSVFRSLYRKLMNLLPASRPRDNASLNLARANAKNRLDNIFGKLRQPREREFSFRILNKGLQKIIHQYEKIYGNEPTGVYSKSILLVLVTKREISALEKILQRLMILKSLHMKRGQPIKVGVYNGFELFVLQTGMGSLGHDSAGYAIADALHIVSPKYVIMGGIGFGLKEGIQKMTDLMVATSIKDYESGKVGEGEYWEDRGEEHQSSKYLISLAHILSQNRADTHFGQMLCGNKVIDNTEMMEKFKQVYPDAIGGDMEGNGLAVACERTGIEWILIKGICDWGHGKNDDNQDKAALQSFDFCLNLIKLAAASDGIVTCVNQ